jgi:bacterioferritin-associated ferredoxin
MNDEYSNSSAEIICFCTGTTKAKIQRLIESGVDTLKEISTQTGANTGCGSCDVLILDLLAKHKATIEKKAD